MLPKTSSISVSSRQWKILPIEFMTQMRNKANRRFHSILFSLLISQLFVQRTATAQDRACSLVFACVNKELEDTACENIKFCSNRGRCTAFNVCDCDAGWLWDSWAVADCSARNECNGNGNGVCVEPNVYTSMTEQGYTGKIVNNPIQMSG